MIVVAAWAGTCQDYKLELGRRLQRTRVQPHKKKQCNAALFSSNQSRARNPSEIAIAPLTLETFLMSKMLTIVERESLGLGPGSRF